MSVVIGLVAGSDPAGFEQFWEKVMNGVHDMGGMHGFGSINYEADEPVFHQPWEGRVYAMNIITPVPIKGGFRYAIERLEPELYLATSYYERWLHACVRTLIESGTFSAAEFAERLDHYRQNPEAVPPRTQNAANVRQPIAALSSSKTQRHEADFEPAYGVGDVVRTRNSHPAGHTRLPRYARGKQARIVNIYGLQNFDDAMSAGLGPQPQPLYCIRFEGAELWGDSAEANSAVYLDAWESYLEPL